MTSFMSLIKDYFVQSKIVLAGYIVTTVIFYILNYIFFSKSIDLPADIIFIIIYIVFSPGVITLITIYRNRVVLIYNNEGYYFSIVLHSITVLLINTVALAIYEVFRINQGYWENIFIAILVSVPIIFVGMIIAFEYKLRFEYLGCKIVGLIAFFVSWYMLDMFLNHASNRYLMQIINASYLLVTPFLLIVFWYRKRLTEQ